ncbi:MAG: mechanosensitive ion channel family protein [Bacilli bacterium]|nr:mechanosensitive ion channel family protein [Bacilli bacterium]
MKLFSNFCEYLSHITTIDKQYLELFISTLFIILVFLLLRKIGKTIISSRTSGRKEFLLTQTYFIILNVCEILMFLFIWDDFIKSLMTLISVISAAMTIVLREFIMNFFCGIYIKMKRPFKVEDRIQIDDLRGDVMNISALDFEVLEISTKEENGQSTGVVVSIPNSYVFTKSIKNLTKGFKYIWDEITIKVPLDCDLAANKQEIYKIVNGIETIKNIPRKMKAEVDHINSTTRIYFNQYDPIIYTKIVGGHVELTVRYLMHPKKARYIESVIWNKIYTFYKEGKINLYEKD